MSNQDTLKIAIIAPDKAGTDWFLRTLGKGISLSRFTGSEDGQVGNYRYEVDGATSKYTKSVRNLATEGIDSLPVLEDYYQAIFGDEPEPIDAEGTFGESGEAETAADVEPTRLRRQRILFSVTRKRVSEGRGGMGLINVEDFIDNDEQAFSSDDILVELDVISLRSSSSRFDELADEIVTGCDAVHLLLACEELGGEAASTTLADFVSVLNRKAEARIGDDENPMRLSASALGITKIDLAYFGRVHADPVTGMKSSTKMALSMKSHTGFARDFIQLRLAGRPKDLVPGDFELERLLHNLNDLDELLNWALDEGLDHVSCPIIPMSAFGTVHGSETLNTDFIENEDQFPVNPLEFVPMTQSLTLPALQDQDRPWKTASSLHIPYQVGEGVLHCVHRIDQMAGISISLPNPIGTATVSGILAHLTSMRRSKPAA